MRVIYAIAIFVVVFVFVQISNRMRRKVYYGDLVVEKVEEYQDVNILALSEGRRVVGKFTSDDGVKFDLSFEISYDDFCRLHTGDTVKCGVVKIGKKLDGFIDDGRFSYYNLYEEVK